MERAWSPKCKQSSVHICFVNDGLSLTPSRSEQKETFFNKAKSVVFGNCHFYLFYWHLTYDKGKEFSHLNYINIPVCSQVVLVQGHYLSFLPLCSRNEPVFLATCTPVAMPETRECVVQGATNVFTTIHSMDMKFVHVDRKWVFWFFCSNRIIRALHSSSRFEGLLNCFSSVLKLCPHCLYNLQRTSHNSSWVNWYGHNCFLKCRLECSSGQHLERELLL